MTNLVLLIIIVPTIDYRPLERTSRLLAVFRQQCEKPHQSGRDHQRHGEQDQLRQQQNRSVGHIHESAGTGVCHHRLQTRGHPQRWRVPVSTAC